MNVELRHLSPSSRPRLLAAISGLVALCGLPASAQSSLESALAEWRLRHGSGWRMEVDAGTGAAAMLYGGSATAPFAPQADAGWFELARLALAEAAALHAIELQTLVEDRALRLPLGMVGTSDKVTVRFRQAVGDVPVELGSVNVLFDSGGRLLSIQAHALPGIAAMSVAPAIGADGAASAALARFAQDTSLEGSVRGTPELVIAQLESGERRVPRLAVKTTVLWADPGFEPEGFTYYVDALTGEIAHRERSIHHADVGAVVSTLSTPGVHPDGPSNPPSEQPLRYARVESAAGAVYTDSDGRFCFPGVDGPLTCKITFLGALQDVRDVSGPLHALQADLEGTDNVVVLNEPSAPSATAQANAFVELARIRDWIRTVNPFDTTADFVRVANCNLPWWCNAFFDGSSINFFAAGGTCPNMAYSSIVAHEDGHWLNVRYGIGNDEGGMGEGSADVFALYGCDDRYVGRDFFDVGQHLRDGENTVQFCGDGSGGCHGGLHADGQVFMGAAWKVRRNLVSGLGEAAGEALADALFLGWHNAYDQSRIESVIEAQWLTLDDDDGNLDDGTPHFQGIDLAFREQGFPGVPYTPISLAMVPLPDTTDEAGPYPVTVTASSSLGATLADVRLRYSILGAPFTELPMSSTGGDQWTASIPGQPSPARIFYYVVAADSLGNQASHPILGPVAPPCFSIGSPAPLFADDFELDRGWTWNPSLDVGEWTRGDPIGTVHGGVAAQPEEDNPLGEGTLCCFTGQGTPGGAPDENDVDFGPRTVTSPAVPVPFADAELRYAYWLHSSAGDDELWVEVSTDGSAWTTVRRCSAGAGGWKQDKVDLGSHVALGGAVRVRFRIWDTPNDSITEAAVDDVRISTLLPTGCTLATVFCSSKIDSNFCVPSIRFAGHPSLEAAEFTIDLANASGQRNGLLFYGYGPQSSPFQGGVLCCRQPVTRTAVQPTGGTALACDGSMSFDFGAHARSGVDALLVPGQECAAQYYYRDPLDPFGTALSDALSFTICP